MKKFLSMLLLGLMLSSNVSSQKVWVCMSSGAECYHKERKCKGLCNCRKTIKEVTLEEAKEMGRRPCKMCYN